jgi:hypothetical protein
MTCHRGRRSPSGGAPIRRWPEVVGNFGRDTPESPSSSAELCASAFPLSPALTGIPVSEAIRWGGVSPTLTRAGRGKKLVANGRSQARVAPRLQAHDLLRLVARVSDRSPTCVPIFSHDHGDAEMPRIIVPALELPCLRPTATQHSSAFIPAALFVWTTHVSQPFTEKRVVGYFANLVLEPLKQTCQA